jgi:hypothetical protein
MLYESRLECIRLAMDKLKLAMKECGLEGKVVL